MGSGTLTGVSPSMPGASGWQVVRSRHQVTCVILQPRTPEGLGSGLREMEKTPGEFQVEEHNSLVLHFTEFL